MAIKGLRQSVGYFWRIRLAAETHIGSPDTTLYVPSWVKTMSSYTETNITGSHEQGFPKDNLLYGPIVGAIDFDGSAKDVIHVACAIGRVLGRKVIFAHSVSSFLQTDATFDPLEAYNENVTHARQHLSGMLTQEIGTEASSISMEIHLKPPVQLLSEIATTQKAGLIVVGTHGRSGFMHTVFGSVSESVLQQAPCPVLVLGPNFSFPSTLTKTILFATDLEQTGLLAAQYAGWLTVKQSCRLYMLHVPAQKARGEGRIREWVEDALRTKLFRLLEPGNREVCRYEAVIAYGDPGQEILVSANNFKADLIILGVGNEGEWGGRWPAGTALQVIRNARCPVLCVGPKAS